MQRFCLQIGPLTAEINGLDKPKLKLPLAYQPFLYPTSQKPDWVFDVSCKEFPSWEKFQTIYDSKESWALFQDGDSLWFSRPSPAAEPPWTLLRLNPAEKRGTFFLRRAISGRGGYTPFAFPLDQLLFIYCLSFFEALVVHSFGVGVGDFGYVFAGHSGFGKSTLGSLFKKHEKDCVPLSDDRPLIAREGKNWRLFGTPWHGTAKICANASFPLKQLLFLKHGLQNQLRPLGPSEAAAKLFAMSFPVVWNSQKTEEALSHATHVVTEIPCFEFSFRPDKSAVAFLKENLF